MKLTPAEVEVLAKMGDVFIEDGSYLIDDELDLMRRVLEEDPKLEAKCPYLVHFLEHGEPPRAKRMTRAILQERNKASKKKRVSNKPVKKRKAPQKTCSECGAKVHARKKICPCGYEF